MITPRPYISYSQMALFERSPELYAEQYIYGKKQKSNVNMDYGSKMADGLEKDEATGDPVLDLMMAHLPKFELMDIPFEADLPNGKEIIKVLIKPDSLKKDFSGLKEYKLSTRNWTQRMVDESDQITFYATGCWLIKKKIPEDMELCVVKVRYRGNSGVLEPTGEILRFPTKRGMVDIIKMTSRIKKAWAGIQALCEAELL